MNTFGTFSTLFFIILGEVTSLETFEQANPLPKIYNGRSADKDDYRWMAWLYDKVKNKMVCGGSLVEDQWVLTTANCASKDFDNVVVGDYNMFEPDGEQSIKVAKVIIHPFFDSRILANDVALIKLAYPVDLTDGRAQVLRRLMSPELSKATHLKLKQCMMSGWGLTLSSDYFWPTPKELQELRVKIIDDDKCLNDGLKMSRNSFCFQSYKRHASPCMRDEGSPIVCKIRNRWTQVGLYSFARKGDGCKFGPKGATSILSLRRWIRRTMREKPA